MNEDIPAVPVTAVVARVPLPGRDGKKRKSRRKHARVPRIDHGTPELQQKRIGLVGQGDLTKSDHVLGILLERGIITQGQYRAGQRYKYLMRVGVDRGALAPGDGNSATMLTADERSMAEAKITQRWHEATDVLLRAGRRAKDAVENVAVFDRMPRWTRRMIGQPDGPHLGEGEQREMLALILGLQRLVEIGCMQQEGEAG